MRFRQLFPLELNVLWQGSEKVSKKASGTPRSSKRCEEYKIESCFWRTECKPKKRMRELWSKLSQKWILEVGKLVFWYPFGNFLNFWVILSVWDFFLGFFGKINPKKNSIRHYIWILPHPSESYFRFWLKITPKKWHIDSSVSKT